MPGGDRTGPLGMGSGTGRGAGYCRGYGMPGFANRWTGAGWGAGRGGGFGMGRGGFGRGFRNRYWATGVPGWASYRGAVGVDPYYNESSRPSATQETRYLKEQAEFLRNELNKIDRRLSELDAGKET